VSTGEYQPHAPESSTECGPASGSRGKFFLRSA